MQYARRLISCPVVRLRATIILAPNQLRSRMQAYTDPIMTGMFVTTVFSALTNREYRFVTALRNLSFS